MSPPVEHIYKRHASSHLAHKYVFWLKDCYVPSCGEPRRTARPGPADELKLRDGQLFDFRRTNACPAAL